VVVPPEQIVLNDALLLTVGRGLTVIVLVAIFVQPVALVPVTVYVVVAVGDTVTDDPDKLPGFQVYVAAPFAVSVVVPPEQIVLNDALLLTEGRGLTVIVLVAIFVQPVALVPVTVYVVVAVGDTVTEDPDKLPGFQVYVDPPVALNDKDAPEHIDVLLAFAAIAGAELTVMVSVAVDAHADVGVNVYVVVFKLFIAGDQLPEMPLVEVVGRGDKIWPAQIGLTGLKEGTAILLQ
jgi:hypothetical protein